MKEKRLDKPEKADIEILANVKTRELRFEEKPETEVRFSGSSERESVSGTERENLPRPVEPGVTYRDARVRLRIASAIVEGDRKESDDVMDDVKAASSAKRGERNG